jgi:hypothetical protein
MGVVLKVPPPCMEHACGSGFSAKIAPVISKDLHCLPRTPEEQAIELFLIAVKEWVEFRRDGEHHMVVTDIKKITSTLLYPLLFAKGLAFRAVAVFAAVVGDADLPTLGTCFTVAAESGSPASNNGIKGPFLLVGKQVRLSVLITIANKDVLDLNHNTPPYR